MALFAVVWVKSYRLMTTNQPKFIKNAQIRAKSSSKTQLNAGGRESFEGLHDYLQELKTRDRLPQGFEVAATRFTFSPYEVRITQLNAT